MRWLVVLFLMLGVLGFTKTAVAEPWQVVTNCGAQTLVAGDGVGGFIDHTGLVCVSGSGGGGGSVTQGTTPWVDDITQWANVALGTPSNYGTSPGAVTVPGVNAFVTNPVSANPGTAANWGVGATASAPPANAIYNGANGSGATGGQLQGLTVCDKYVFKHITSATDTLAVQGVASQTVRICGFHARAAGVATWFLENTASANANCSSSNTQISILNTEAANTGITDHTPFWSGLSNTSGNGLCINSTGTGGVDVGIYYAQF